MAQDVIRLLFGVEGGASINGASGQQIVGDLTGIVNAINSGQSTVPKVKLQFDVSGATAAVNNLVAQLQKLGSGGGGGRRGSGGTSGSKATQAQSEQYKKLTIQVKEYYNALAEMEKIQMKNSNVTSNGGAWTTNDPQYQERVANITRIQTALQQMGVVANSSNNLQLTSAQALNLSQEEYTMLVKQNESAIQANAVTHERNQSKIDMAWDKNSAKVIEYVNKIRGLGNMNPKVAQMALELEQMAMSGDPTNLDAMSEALGRFQSEVHQSGADMETFGHKLSKTFGSQLRYMLTSMVYMKALQFIRDLYNNVVELDKAMTDLQIASGKTREEIKALTKTYSALAQQLGATTLEVAQGADTWLRQGYAAEEANTLIRNSTMLSKLGQMEAAEASTALTSAMKGYKVSVEESIGVVDKLTAVDMEAAASAGDIATAMAETAASADIAGVSMDKLIGYIATVKEVTQDGAESVGKQNCLTIQ